MSYIKKIITGSFESLRKENVVVQAKESVKKLAEYKPARSIVEVSRKYGFAEKDLIKLAGNENRWGGSPKVIKAINDNRAFFSYYPDVNSTKLREKLVKKHNVSEDNLIFGNGSFELLTLEKAMRLFIPIRLLGGT